jgi:hypothetical protein
MANSSKAKGNAWEREVAKYLTELYGEPFLRVIGSGAFVGGANKRRMSMMNDHQGKAHKGDITPPDTWMFWNAEAKNYADFKFHHLLLGRTYPLDGWITQMKEVEKEGDLNIIMIKITRKGKYVMVPGHHEWSIDGIGHYNYHSEQHGHWIMFDFELFWAHNKDNVKKICIGN